MKKRIRTKENIRTGIILLVTIIIYICFIIGLCAKNIQIVSVSGILMIVVLFIGIINILIQKGKLNILGWVEIIFDFVPAAFLIAIHLSSIRDQIINNTFVAIAASCLGGFLSLLGVGLTIKYSRIEKQEDELKRLRPYIFTISEKTWNTIDSDKRNSFVVEYSSYDSELKHCSDDKKRYVFQNLLVGCSDLSMCTLNGILINGKHFIQFDYEQVILKNSSNEIEINCPFYLKENVETIALVLCDMISNVYEANMRFELIDKKEQMIISLKSVLNMKLSKMYIENGYYLNS